MSADRSKNQTIGRGGGDNLSPPPGGEWFEHISHNLAHFGEKHGLKYAGEVEPCVIQGQRCLLLGRELALRKPVLMTYLFEFAQDNHLKVKEDRRSLDLPTSVERRAH